MSDQQSEPKNIHEALFALQANPPLLTKQKEGQVGSQRTKYADLPAVNAQVLSRLNELGVIWTCAPTLLDDSAQGPGRFVLRYSLRHIASETSIDGHYPLGAGEPQKMGSAITYARRYALLAVTGVAAEDEDDDGSGNGPTTAARKPRKATASTRATSRSTPATGGGSDDDPKRKQRQMFALFRDIDLGGADDREARLALVASMLGREVGSVNDLTPAEADGVIDALGKAKNHETPMTAAVEIYQRTSGAGAPQPTMRERTRAAVTGAPAPSDDDAPPTDY